MEIRISGGVFAVGRVSPNLVTNPTIGFVQPGVPHGSFLSILSPNRKPTIYQVGFFSFSILV
jgi:hypothetical protein